MIDPTSSPLPESPQPKPSPSPLRIRARAIAVTFAAQAVLIAWTADSEIARGIYLICYALMMPTVLYLLAARLLQGWLERHEVLFSYVVLTGTLPIIGFGAMRFLLPGAGYLPYFSETQPQWARYLGAAARLPVLHDPAAIRGLYRGAEGVPWGAWLPFIGFWSVYLLALSGVWLGLAALLHRVWIRQERLTFPVAVLPLQLTDPRDDVLHRPLFWLGCAIPAVMQSLLALHDWFPAVPAVQLKAFDVRPLFFTSPPWSSIPDISIGFYPMAIGLAYFVPSHVSLSCWLFWLVAKLSYVGGAMAGLDSGGAGSSRFPFKEEQAAGAWIAFGLMALWTARRSLQSARSDLSDRADRSDNGQIRLWAGGAVACGGVCILMMLAAGMTGAMAALVLTVYVLYVVSGARVRAEAGGQWTFAPALWTPYRVATAALGSRDLGLQPLAAGAHFDLVHVDIRGQSLPYVLEGLKIADSAGIPWQTVLRWVGLGTVTALALGWWSSLSNFYAVGATTAHGNAYVLTKARIEMDQMHAAANSHAGPDTPGLGAMVFGATVTLLLAALRARFSGFPLHAVGYVLANTFTMNAFFVPFLLAWAAKVFIQRLGNITYRRSIPFFVGLILGDIATQAGWAIIGRILDKPVYQFLS